MGTPTANLKMYLKLVLGDELEPGDQLVSEIEYIATTLADLRYHYMEGGTQFKGSQAILEQKLEQIRMQSNPATVFLILQESSEKKNVVQHLYDYQISRQKFHYLSIWGGQIVKHKVPKEAKIRNLSQYFLVSAGVAFRDVSVNVTPFVEPEGGYNNHVIQLKGTVGDP